MKELVDISYYLEIYEGRMPSEDFKSFIKKSSRLIQSFTDVNLFSCLDDDIKDACCEIADFLYEQENLKNVVLLDNEKKIVSQTVGPVSKTFSDNTNLKFQKILSNSDIEKECYKICKKYLLKKGLLYRGLNNVSTYYNNF